MPLIWPCVATFNVFPVKPRIHTIATMKCDVNELLTKSCVLESFCIWDNTWPFLWPCKIQWNFLYNLTYSSSVISLFPFTISKAHSTANLDNQNYASILIQLFELYFISMKIICSVQWSSNIIWPSEML